jgi:methionyl-tRNA synthetase
MFKAFILSSFIQYASAYGHLGHTVSGLIADLLVKAQTAHYVQSLVGKNISDITTW